MDAHDKTGRERKERLRQRRDKAGMAQVSGWVPKDRRAYAREVIAALAKGANSLPPDPEQAAALDAAWASIAAARIAEAEVHAVLEKAEQRGQALVDELDAARADTTAARIGEAEVRVALEKAEHREQTLMVELDAVLEAGHQAEAALLARAEAAERAREAIAGELRLVEALAAQVHAEVERFQKAPGLRGHVMRWLTR